ncbi:hypothetical protein SETIT_2G370200v2 [Setaria italica]|uniref:Uncharacterized protein n=1 Tax=Setaria italica TaxID=4555 RepID=A0A368Q7B3_SETIT|nr:hypothetical protein SETIT_2G370200v2 [Setaria italica]
MSPQEHESTYKRIERLCTRFLRAVNCRDGDADVLLPPQGAYPGSSSAPPMQHRGSSSAPPMHHPELRDIVPQQYRGFSAARPSSRGLRVDDLAYIGRGGTDDESVEDEIHRTSSASVDSFYSYDTEEIGPSQLGDAPVPPT